MQIESKNIILFDGVCNLCSFSVQFIIERDPKGYFHFAAIESELGQQLIQKYDLGTVDSLILVQNGEAHIYSDAVLHIAKGLSSWHRHVYFFHFLPQGFRNRAYKLIAKFRYDLFGKKEQCMIPTPEIENRFLEEKKV